MQEDFLHYLWRMKRFDLSHLRSTQGEPIEILAVGDHNIDAGPDFIGARIRLGETLWAGSVEMHLRSSDWCRHHHQDDQAYRNVILHVVLEEDRPIFRANGERLPCLELRHRIPAGLTRNYRRLFKSAHWIPCQPQFHGVPELTRQLWLERLPVERLQQKVAVIRDRLRHNQRNWEETFFQFLARSFGVKVNADPFEELARVIPLQLLLKHKTSLFQIEALLFGQAGFLDEALTDEYPNKLRKEYAFLQKKYQLPSRPVSGWKLLRLRPANFPTIRLAQFATLIFQSGHLFSKMLAVESPREIENMFEVRLSNYWKDHYVFDKLSPRQTKKLGRTAIQLITINTIVPFLFFYGQDRQEVRYQEKALRLLEELPPERNNIIEGWKTLGVKPESAYQTQALLELKRAYCDRRRCLQCAIGAAILR